MKQSAQPNQTKQSHTKPKDHIPSSNMDIQNTKVCVTAGTSYLGSSLIKQLLQKGYTVHATTRNLGDEGKVGPLKGLVAGAESRLKFFEADIYASESFEAAIHGCRYVFHLATPYQLDKAPINSQYKDTSEAAVAGVKSIVKSCMNSGTVKRLVYTASVTAASPINPNGIGFKDLVDESCWTPSTNVFIPRYSAEWCTTYTDSKTLAEKELLGYNGAGLEIVSLACGLVGGDTILSNTPTSVAVLISQITNNEVNFHAMRYMEELSGKLPIIHIDDVCRAHIFAIENSAVNGRYLCSGAFVSTKEIADYYRSFDPNIKIEKEFEGISGRDIRWKFGKLEKLGFKYKYGMEMILSDSLNCAKRLGSLD